MRASSSSRAMAKASTSFSLRLLKERIRYLVSRHSYPVGQDRVPHVLEFARERDLWHSSNAQGVPNSGGSSARVPRYLHKANQSQAARILGSPGRCSV